MKYSSLITQQVKSICLIACSIMITSELIAQPRNPKFDSYQEYNSQNRKSLTKSNITLSAAFENDFYTSSNREGHYYVELNSGSVDRYSNEKDQHIPLNISVVIDRSGSMGGEKMRNAKEAAKFIIDQLSSDDYVSIVTYDGQVELLQPTTRVTNKQYIKNKIGLITDRGGTNLMGGALKGYEEVRKSYKEGYVNRVLLLSDGQANEGITNPTEIEKIVRKQSRDHGISTSTFGLGIDYNEDLMTAMAESGTGNYYFINNSYDIANIFRKELNGLMDVVAQQATLKITIPEYVNIEKIYGQRYSQNGRIISIPMHDISANETKSVLIRYKVNNGMNSKVNFNSSLSFRSPSNEKNGHITLDNQSDFTTNQSIFYQAYNEWVSSQVALFESNDQLEMATKEADKGNYDEARKIVKKNKEYMTSKAPLVKKSGELQKAETANDSYTESLKDIEAMPVSEQKVLQKSTKNINYELRTKKK